MKEQNVGQHFPDILQGDTPFTTTHLPNTFFFLYMVTHIFIVYLFLLHLPFLSIPQFYFILHTNTVCTSLSQYKTYSAVINSFIYLAQHDIITFFYYIRIYNVVFGHGIF